MMEFHGRRGIRSSVHVDEHSLGVFCWFLRLPQKRYRVHPAGIPVFYTRRRCMRFVDSTASFGFVNKIARWPIRSFAITDKPVAYSFARSSSPGTCNTATLSAVETRFKCNGTMFFQAAIFAFCEGQKRFRVQVQFRVVAAAAASIVVSPAITKQSRATEELVYIPPRQSILPVSLCLLKWLDETQYRKLRQ
jgi:hypothetical protein